jgi:lipopolysaccharide/colanic/teichoic acid biosynthesis glycosyltransferase
MVDILVVPDILQFVMLRAGIEILDGIPMINLAETPLSGWYAPVKRTVDIVFSLLFLVALAPLLAAIAIAIKLTSLGPVLYHQQRMSLDGSLFEMFKFRSMRVDAEAETGAVWACRDDPRRTAVGAFLRRTSLDKLPQLLNILCQRFDRMNRLTQASPPSRFWAQPNAQLFECRAPGWTGAVKQVAPFSQVVRHLW